MLKLRITKQYDCKGKWYIISLEDKGRIIKETEIDVRQHLYQGYNPKETIKKHIRIAIAKYKGWVVIKDESRGEWKYLQHLVPIADNGEVGTPRKATISRIKGELC